MASSAPSTPDTPPSVVRYLVKLPRELVHRVLDNLCISQVLSLSLHNVPYIHECILGQLDYKRIFRKPSELHKATEYFRLSAAVLYALSISPHKHTTILGMHPSCTKITYSELITHLHVQTAHLIDRVTPRAAELAVLSALSPTPLHGVWNSSTLELLQSRWTSLSELTEALNVKKSEQLRKVGALVAAYPRILGAGLAQQIPGGNPNHLPDFLERRAEVLLRPKCGVGRKQMFPFKLGLPVLPYDRYLRLFLKVLERYPLPDEDMPGIVPPGGKIPTGEKARRGKLLHSPEISAEIQARLNHQYTPEAIENIRRAILGLTYSYTLASTSFVPPGTTWPIPSPTSTSGTTAVSAGTFTFGSHTAPEVGKGKEIASAEPTNLRTKYTPYSAYPYNKSGGHSQPCFVLPDRMEAYAALSDMELQWLESFLWSCEYMANMHDARWNETTSVAEMWHRRSRYVC